MYSLYNLFSCSAIPFALLRVLYKSIKLPAYRDRILERLGVVSFSPLNNSIWIHGVSVGESNVALLLVRELKNRLFHLPVVITTTTPTGSEIVKKNLKDNMYHCYLPYDCPLLVKKFIGHIKPVCFIVIETEIWPGIFGELHKKNIPIIIANGRISPSSFKNYLKIKGFISKVLDKCSLILTQNEQYRERFLRLGARKEKVFSTGNIKFDMSIPIEKVNEGRKIKSSYFQDYKILIGASTHEGEEKLLIDIYFELINRIKNLKLILVPRHPERFFSVYELAKSHGLVVHRRSKNIVPPHDFQVYIGDSMGEMMMYYAMSDVAFVGGSFAKVGGHNMLEPLFVEVPVVIGPHYFNFQEITEILKSKNAILIANNKMDLKEKILKLFLDDKLRHTILQSAKQITEKNRGALNRTIEKIYPIVKQKLG